MLPICNDSVYVTLLLYHHIVNRKYIVLQLKSSGFHLLQIRTTGTEADVEEIRKYSKLFEDEITLDTLNHKQLMALCRVLEIPMPNLGTSNFLRFQLRLKLRQLETDDKVVLIKK